ncbi:MAG: type II secretion system protein GspK [Candidatus Hydrogenedentes bacterium]|nr:type II secretion system protein GspK [Candidatus Hydrogenedentota bacterium]
MATRAPNRRNDEGVALMLVLLLVVLLSAITFEYAYETQVEASLAANGRGDMEAYVAAKSAVAVGMGLLMSDQMQDVYGEYAQSAGQALMPNPANNQNRQNQRNPQNQQAGFGEYDCKWTDAWGQPIVQPINNATMHCNIEDECGKLNLNVFSDFSAEQEAMQNADVNGQANPVNPANPVDPNNPNPNQPGAPVQARMEALETVLRNLFDQMELEVNPTDAILDWLDVDDEPRPEGAESDYYESLETPYACKNGPMESIEELLLIAGITPEIYFDLNRDPDETQELRQQEDPLYPLSSLPDLLTVCGSIKGKININTARPELLMALFQDPAAVDTIVAAQQQTPFQDIQDLGTSVSLPNEFNDLLDVKSNVFRIQGDGFMDDVMVRVEAYVVRPDAYSEIPMPFRILSWRVIR